MYSHCQADTSLAAQRSCAHSFRLIRTWQQQDHVLTLSGQYVFGGRALPVCALQAPPHSGAAALEAPAHPHPVTHAQDHPATPVLQSSSSAELIWTVRSMYIFAVLCSCSGYTEGDAGKTVN